MRFPRILSIFSLLLLAGCSTISEDMTENWSVERFYEEAKSALDNGDYAGAIDKFTQLEARYPYGRYAQQAQLETIYAYYKDNEPASAVAAADRFIKLHPRHPNVDYAFYLRGLATFNQGKGAFEGLFKQDRAKRDPASLRESFNYFRELVTRYPDSQYTPDAIERMTELRNTLARHELVVADYYMRRRQPRQIRAGELPALDRHPRCAGAHGQGVSPDGHRGSGQRRAARAGAEPSGTSGPGLAQEREQRCDG